MVSVGTQLKQINGLRDTADLTDWEAEFVKSIWERCQGETTRLTSQQVEKIDEIWRKHFA